MKLRRWLHELKIYLIISANTIALTPLFRQFGNLTLDDELLGLDPKQVKPISL